MAGRYQTYPGYKDSGLEWLGDLPEHWEIKRLGQFFEERREKVSDKDYPALSVTMQGIVPQLEHAAKTDAGDNRKLVLKNDFVINSRSDRKGSSGVSPLDGSVSLISIVMIPKKINPKFAHHLLRSYPFQEEFYRYGKGIVADLWSTNSSEMKNILIPDIPEDEEVAIANFLDHETSKIDTLIEKQQQLIKLLKEKRQAVISCAVTKGLNPNAPMRDSGVEWLGEVPEHWKVVSLKHLVSAPIIDGPHLTPTRQDNGVPFVSAEAISKGFINFEKKWGYISKDDHEIFSKRYCPQKGDILMVKLGATTGVVAMVETDRVFNVWVPLATIRIGNNIPSKFIFYLLQSSSVRDAIQLSWTYGTQQTLGLGTLANLSLPVPPKVECKKIIDLIESKVPLYDKSVEKSEESLLLLKERRIALISAAVTGKIDVRNWQPLEPSNNKLNNKEVAA